MLSLMNRKDGSTSLPTNIDLDALESWNMFLKLIF